ncbi:SHOCT domain-containing protein [Demequina sp. SYSU T00039]|uniref:SHOCT domain-containing protein n=1 Tax=Demequina lignilytica TaxID=3051663 RepID=A0AAW7MAC4_9MICO|nr:MULTISPECIES: SHOCT domain-containing protein [unclassified Demequina]MDN4478760.1 SHOCT domain-containing protein [Demequina sp. SYSU T00039-1]MDN4488737.1 SHOCT domain-containing protein [Demequina sp. SYSU T00039]MDN4491655.1 SHOCT domain-containing protein [Demequina sp. SYSU T00068]
MDFFANFLNILLWSLWFAIWISFIFLVIRFIVDVFRDDKLSVVGKIFWTLLLVILPVLGALVYIFTRGKGMAERDLAAAKDMRAAQVEYTKGLMDEAGAASEIKAAKELLDSGAITAEEYDKLKAKALA